MRKCALFLCATLLPTCLSAQSTLNMSHELVGRGIAGSDLQPNVPTLDSRPLLEAAIAYAQANGIATLTADPGNYYFLSLHQPITHVLINSATNLTIDFHNSDLYFKQSNRSAFLCQNCNAVTLQNFTVDFLQLPFTQVTITAVDTKRRTLTFETIPGYQSPSDFNALRTPGGVDTIYGFVFRNGVPIPQTGELTVVLPTNGNLITLGSPGDPWANPAALAAIQPGDTLVYTDRGGPHTIHFDGGKNSTVHNVSIYSSGAMALTMTTSSGMTIDHVQIIPRPGTTRLISGNADGIHTLSAGINNTFSNNIIRRTCDDPLAFDSPWAATVSQTPSGMTVAVDRYSFEGYPVGASLAFIDPATDAVVGTAVITGENPPYSQQKFTAGETVTLTLDRAVSGLAQGFGVVTLDPAQHGAGSVMQYNLVQEGVFSRGIWLSGITNVSLHDNFIQRTSKTGIFIQQVNATATQSGPSSNITIKNNVVDSAISYGGPSIGPIVTAASIHTVSENTQAAQVATSPHSNIVVTGNRVTNSPRTAIRFENVNGGQISGNVIQGYGLAPTTNVYLIPSCCETVAQYELDFTKPLLATASIGVTLSGNTVSDTATWIANASTASYSPKVAVESLAFAYGSNLAVSTVFAPSLPLPTTLDGVSVTVTDSAGVSRPAPLIAVSPTQINYQVPSGTAPGIATVTAGQSSGGLLIDTLAPSLYSANSSGQGVAAAYAALYSATGDTTPEPVFRCTAGAGTCVSTPMSLGAPTDRLIVSLFGTGLRNLSSLENASATIGGARAQILYIGAQPTYPGLDQVNLIVPASLAGAGEVPVILTVDGQTANVVTINLT